MNEKEIALAERLIESLGDGTNTAVDAYAVWHLASAIWWIAAGIALLFVARYLWNYKLKGDWSDDGPPPNKCGAAAAVVIAVLVIGTHVPDLLAPRAIAIHQLIKDVVPG